MEQLAYTLLRKLLADAEKQSAGRRSRSAVLTTSNLAPYHAIRSLQEKEAFEAVMQAARGARAISYAGDTSRNDGFIQRIELADLRALAAFLGQTLHADRLGAAQQLLAPFISRFPVLDDVLARWSRLRTVRTFAAEDAQDWVDAVRVIDSAQAAIASGASYTPVYEASARLFNDSKRIKQLVAPIDVLLTGSLEGEARADSEVLEEIGLFREEHPVRLAGNVMVERGRMTACLDAPYVGLPADSVVRLASVPDMVLTIENQTTFHSEARRRCNENVLLIFTAGTPNPPWRAMYSRLLRELPSSVPVYHWGDIDEGGFRIASILAKAALDCGHVLKPWKMMHPWNVPVDLRRPAAPATIERMRRFAVSAGWAELGDAIAACKFTIEQESL